MDKLLKPEEGVSTAKQKVMLLLVPVLFVALIFVLLPLFKGPSHRRPGAGNGSADSAARLGGEIDWEAPAPYPAGLRDPMQPGSTTTSANGTKKAGPGIGVRLIVKGIVYSKENPAAVIGTQLVHEGDVISNATVVKINRDNVEFKMNGKRWMQRVE